MRLLGIDYGTKKVGLALSDETGRFAAPYKVIPNNEFSIQEIQKICVGEKVGVIVVGESLDNKGEPNPIMAEIEKFTASLKGATGLPLEKEKEFFTSAEAERLIGRDELYDARAAAIILRNYIDRKK